MSLLDEAAQFPNAMKILKDPFISHVDAVEDLAIQWHINTTEASVRRARQKLEAGSLPTVKPEMMVPDPARGKSSIPHWKPGKYEIGKDTWEIRTEPTQMVVGTGKGTETEVLPDEDRILRAENLDPEKWEIISYRRNHWQVGLEGRWLEGWRVTVKKRDPTKITHINERAEEWLRPYIDRPDKTVFREQSGDIMVVPVGDLQIGKIDGGGTPALVERFGRLTSSVADQIKQRGKLKGLILPWLGDCIEGLVSQNGRLVTRMDLTPDAQVEVYCKLLMHQIGILAPLAELVLVPVVPGNHDETYREVKMPATSSWALMGAHIVEEAMRRYAPEEYEHVRFMYPQANEHDITVNVGPKSHPLTLGFTHGHIMGSSPNSALTWWKGQAHGRQQIGEADILMSAHWHHLRTEFTGGNRTWLQIPALDGGSDWFRQKSGDDVPAGMVTMYLTPGQGCFWRDLTVHS